MLGRFKVNIGLGSRSEIEFKEDIFQSKGLAESYIWTIKLFS